MGSSLWHVGFLAVACELLVAASTSLLLMVSFEEQTSLFLVKIIFIIILSKYAKTKLIIYFRSFTALKTYTFKILGTSLVVQWLRLRAPNAGGSD